MHRSYFPRWIALGPLITIFGCAHPAPRTMKARRANVRAEIVVGPDGVPLDGTRMDDDVEHWSPVHTITVQSDRPCLSGAIEIDLPAVETRFARSLAIGYVSPRPIGFRVDVIAVATSAGPERQIDAVTWGLREEQRAAIDAANERCRGVLTPTPLPAPPPTNANRAHKSAAPDRTPHPTGPVGASPAVPTTTSTQSTVVLRGGHVIDESEDQLSGRFVFGNTAFLLTGDPFKLPAESVMRHNVSTEHWRQPIRIRIWTQAPMDLRDVSFRVSDRVLVPNIPLPKYEILDARRRKAGVERQAAFVAECKANPATAWCPKYATGPLPDVPPAPQPETPGKPPSSAHVWIPGGWQWDGTRYVWLRGVWRVPPAPPRAVIAAAPSPTPRPTLNPNPNPTPRPTLNPNPTPSPTLNPNPTLSPNPNPTPNPNPNPTLSPNPNPSLNPNPTPTLTPTPTPSQPPSSPVALPPAPVVVATRSPPVRTEPIPAAPQAGAHWVAGYWYWQERAWSWQPGRWEVPVAPEQRWLPPVVQPTARGVLLYVPGGWISIGR